MSLPVPTENPSYTISSTRGASVQINPMHTKRLKELGDNSPLKTDKKDSRVITDIKRLGYTLNVVVPEGDAAELRRLMNLRDRHIDERVALMNYLRQLIFLIFPEFFQAIKSLRSTTAMMIVREYLATGSLWKTDHESLGRAIRTTSRKTGPWRGNAFAPCCPYQHRDHKGRVGDHDGHEPCCSSNRHDTQPHTGSGTLH